MEDFVQTRVDELFKNLSESKIAFLGCDCDSCRNDTICYVLNRVPPKYVVSGRGVLHMRSDSDLTQLRADVDAMAIEGIRLISASRRHSHNFIKDDDNEAQRQPTYNFPTFIGALFDGTTFEPLTDASISLYQNNQIAEMMDNTWQNPCNTYKSTKGSYSFCVKSQKAESENINKDFSFTIKVNAAGYESISHAFTVPVTSRFKNDIGNISVYSLKIQDLFLFPEGL